jgi:hypothetical protein
MSRLPALTPDDPLQPTPTQAALTTPPDPSGDSEALPGSGEGQVLEAAIEGARTAAPARAQRARASTLPADVVAPSNVTVELAWSGGSDVVTMRLPTEVLRALDERVRHLAVPKGMTVAAAVLELLKLADGNLIELVDETHQRYDTARRRARRAA